MQRRNRRTFVTNTEENCPCKWQSKSFEKMDLHSHRVSHSLVGDSHIYIIATANKKLKSYTVPIFTC